MPEVFQFSDFTLDPSQCVLRRGDRKVRLENRPMQLLILLVERHGEVVSRDEVAQRLWGSEVFVDVDQGINTAIRKVRMALRDDPNRPRFVETVVGKGYRFSAVVTSADSNPTTKVLNKGELPSPLASGAAEPVESQDRDSRPSKNAKRLWVALFGLIILTVGILKVRQYWWFQKQGAIRSLAVLPLKNLSGDPGQEYLADGITEELIGRLSGNHDLRVVSRTSAMHFKNTQLTVPEISKILRADAVVEGSVIREGDHIRIHAQLIRGATDEHFWSETYDRELPDVLNLQSEVSQAIAAKVKATITGNGQERLAVAHTVVPEAYELYLKGRFALNNSNKRSGVDESVRFFENSVQIDPAFAPAYAGLAAAHLQRGTVMMGGQPESERRQVESNALKALQIDPNLSEAHLLLAKTAQTEWRWAQAQTEYQRALTLNPNDGAAHAGLAQWLLCQGRFEDAMREAERARELDQFGDSNWGMAWILFQSRRYDAAIRELQSILNLRRDDASALWLLGLTLSVEGKAEEAIPLLERASTLADRSSGYIDVLAFAYARAGRPREAHQLLQELQRRRNTEGYVPAASFAIVYLGLGDKEQAFVWVEQAYRERSNILQFVKVHPIFDPLRDDPRFPALLHRIGGLE